MIFAPLSYPGDVAVLIPINDKLHKCRSPRNADDIPSPQHSWNSLFRKCHFCMVNPCNVVGDLVICCTLLSGFCLCSVTGPCLNIKMVFLGMGTSIIKLRWLWDHLMFCEMHKNLAEHGYFKYRSASWQSMCTIPSKFQAHIWQLLAHLPLEEMATISQMTFSNAFSWMKRFEFWLKICRSVFLRVQLTIAKHWFRLWLGTFSAPSHYFDWCSPNSLTHICGIRGRWV